MKTILLLIIIILYIIFSFLCISTTKEIHKSAGKEDEYIPNQICNIIMLVSGLCILIFELIL